MSDKIAGEKLLYCSFCGKSQHEVKKLIAGSSVFICDECIELCNDIIREELQEVEAANQTKSDLPVPRESSNDENSLFRDAVRDIEPLPAADRAVHSHKPPRPIIKHTLRDKLSTPDDFFSDHVLLGMEAGDEWSFLRPGLSRQTLRRLRRGYWKIDAQFDLHGFSRDEAQQELGVFLTTCNKRGFRCVQVIHGKGLNSKNREPVLKISVGGWLAQHNHVLAFCQANPAEGGSGAVVVLLKTSMSKRVK